MRMHAVRCEKSVHNFENIPTASSYMSFQNENEKDNFNIFRVCARVSFFFPNTSKSLYSKLDRWNLSLHSSTYYFKEMSLKWYYKETFNYYICNL